ncbi:response regulator [Algoriphagus aestuariicola]|jgi:CheY-like chemotaxis protein|uniref:Response regulator n=1 Tax=Algoriphagus aestuariicola TaxID=1852016 RepID=A0ABS3BNB9_9BACT|nr:response regulator [Algoriphagus aestuariicola]MBN7800799.1 response regulator [Algoriphagus aestuariicola]
MKESQARIYIIDDDPGVLFLHKIMVKEGKLSDDPITHSDAGKAFESILLLDKHSSRILVFLDINMPHIDGWDFLDLLENNVNHADIKVIMVTSSLSKADREKSKEFARVIDFWEKPIDEEQVAVLKSKLGDWLLSS